jgi:pyruvate dehydrogenase E2 component (dihydrolipoamide acetyltransferase)
MPAMEMDQDTACLVRWLKSEGELVAKGEPLMEIETDKVTVEIESPGAGVLSEISAEPGADVPVGQVVAVLVAESGGKP